MSSPLPYVNLKVSNYGQIVYRGEKNPAFAEAEGSNIMQNSTSTPPGSSKMTSIEVPGYGTLKVLDMSKTGRVIFPHPLYDKHDVICCDTSSATLWMKEHLEEHNRTTASKVQESVGHVQEGNDELQEGRSSTLTSNDGLSVRQKLEGKNASAEMYLGGKKGEAFTVNVSNPLTETVSKIIRMESNPNISASQNLDGDFKPGPSSKFISKSFANPLPGEPSRKAYALIRTENFNRREHKDQLKLFNQLHALIRGTEPRKSTSCVQILTRTKEVVEKLTADQVDLEQTKKALLRKRVTLFETFVQTLNGFPISVKKRALLDTKEMLKKIKEHRGKAVGTDMLPPPSPLPSLSSIKIEGVRSMKDIGRNQEEQKVQGHSDGQDNGEFSVRGNYSTDGTGSKHAPSNRLPAPSPSKVFGAGAPVVGIPAGLSNVSPLKTMSSPTGQKQYNITTPESLVTFVTSSNEHSGNLASPSFVAATASSVTPYSDVTGLQTVKKDGKLVRPMNAYMLWSKQYRRELISKGLDGATVSKLLAEEWHKLEEAEKKKFYNQAEYLRKLHQEQHPDYKYSPKARKPRISPRSSRDDKHIPITITATAGAIDMEGTQSSAHSAMGQVRSNAPKYFQYLYHITINERRSISLFLNYNMY